MQQTFTSNEVIALTGISARQLQWWDERGIVVPSRDGHKRIYSRDDLAEVAILCDLRQRGFSLQKIRTVIRFLQKELGKRLVETVTAAVRVPPADRWPAHFPGRFRPRRGRSAEKRPPADVIGVPKRHHPAGSSPPRRQGFGSPRGTIRQSGARSKASHERSREEAQQFGSSSYVRRRRAS